MRIKRQIIKKLILASVLLIISAGISVLIKESLDTRDPEAALPIITILHDNSPVADQHLYRAGYEWSFFTTTESRLAPSLVPEDLPIVPLDVTVGSTFEIEFTSTPSEITVWRASGQYSTDFSVLETDSPGVFTAPVDSGVYLFRINAIFGGRGEIQYYFALNVI